jgi:hypothetical protein
VSPKFAARLPGVFEWEALRPLLRDLCDEAYTYGYEVRGNETCVTFSAKAARDAFMTRWNAASR